MSKFVQKYFLCFVVLDAKPSRGPVMRNAELLDSDQIPMGTIDNGNLRDNGN